MFKIKCKEGTTYKGHLLENNMVVQDVKETFKKIKGAVEADK
jgi:small nuclear ribonucleoprotein (snRNP)-like protein